MSEKDKVKRLSQKIMAEKDTGVLQTYLKKAAKAESIEQFCREI